jgi:hypothetical protein
MRTYEGFVNGVVNLIELAIPALFGALFVYFVWKVTDAWIINAGDETKRREGKQYAIAAIIAFVVMVTVWSLVRLILNSLF